jgi:cytochrome c-type biogenesis protein CcmH/NrfG
MTINYVPNAARERELLAHLGLGPGASDDEIEAAHDDIVTFLDAAPAALRGWARGRLSDADQTYAILRGGLVDPTPAPRPVSSAPQAADRLAAAPSAAAAVRAAKQPTPRSGSRLADDEADLLEEQDGHPSSAGRKARQAQARANAGRRTVYVRNERLAEPRSFLAGPVRRVAMMGGLLVAVAAVAVGVYTLGQPSVPAINGSPAPAASTAAIDPAAVSALMEKLATNPKDVATLQALANLYYAGGDFGTASSWLGKVLEVEPKNVAALLGSGAASYNLGDYESAESAWRQVLSIDEKNVEAHYDLGWMYLSQNPPDVEKVKAEWTRVIALDPTSDAAKTAASHLQRLDPSFSPGPLPSGSAGAPAASGNASPAPAPTQAPTTAPAATTAPS